MICLNMYYYSILCVKKLKATGDRFQWSPLVVTFSVCQLPVSRKPSRRPTVYFFIISISLKTYLEHHAPPYKTLSHIIIIIHSTLSFTT